LVAVATSTKWRALWTRSHSEQLVHDQLAAKGFTPFLPKMTIWSRRGGVQHLIQVPMFPGYLFLDHEMDKAAYLKVCQVRGLVRVLGDRWDCLAEIPEREMTGIRLLAASGDCVLPHPYLTEGRRVRIMRGPLAGVEGRLMQSQSSRGVLVLSIELLRRSVSVSVDCTNVEPA
jgi:transcription termination/antitermination protein NusG